MAAIEVKNLSREFRASVRHGGMGQAARRLFRPEYRVVRAVEDVSFVIEPGERVAFIGPNGAGKSTTIKVLCGVLHPSAGEVRVAGFVPWRERRALGYTIGTVFGQRSRLWYHLPANDTFDLLARVYSLDNAGYRRRRGELVEAFAIGDLVAKPVRQLSLGERMRCELVASLLHRPGILFLDEPTIGLDVVAKATLRELVHSRSERDGTTVLLTSHDTGDMERVCDRALVIHRGRLMLDQPVGSLRSGFIRRKVVTVVTAEERVDVDLPGVRVVGRAPQRTVLEVETDRTRIETVVQAILDATAVHDITVEDPPLEEIVQAIYERAERDASPGGSP